MTKSLPLAAGAVALLTVLAGAAATRRNGTETASTVTVRRGSMTRSVIATGILQPVRSRTHKSPVAGRDVEITYLIAEGTVVQPGVLLAQVDAAEPQKEVERLQQEVRQLQVALSAAHIERQDAEAAIMMLAEGDGAVTLDEARTAARMAELKATRLKEKYGQMQPLLAKGFLTREELNRIATEAEEAELEAVLARKRASVLTDLTHPREQQRADVQLAQKNSHLENLVGRLEEAERRLLEAKELVGRCSIRAEIPGFVVHDQYLNTAAPRKVRVGDRVGPTQALVTLSDLEQMLLAASINEADMPRVRPGLPASVGIVAFPELRLTGVVTRIAPLPVPSYENGFEQKRFDVLVQLDRTIGKLRPGMTAFAEIVSSTRDGVLLMPVGMVFTHRGGFAARVVGPAGPELRVVQVGASNDEFVEIVDGLREGDRLTR